MALSGAIGGSLALWTVAETTLAHPSNWRAVIAGVVVLGTAAGLFGDTYGLVTVARPGVSRDYRRRRHRRHTGPVRNDSYEYLSAGVGRCRRALVTRTMRSLLCLILPPI